MQTTCILVLPCYQPVLQQSSAAGKGEPTAIPRRSREGTISARHMDSKYQIVVMLTTVRNPNKRHQEMPLSA